MVPLWSAFHLMLRRDLHSHSPPPSLPRPGPFPWQRGALCPPHGWQRGTRGGALGGFPIGTRPLTHLPAALGPPFPRPGPSPSCPAAALSSDSEPPIQDNESCLQGPCTLLSLIIAFFWCYFHFDLIKNKNLSDSPRVSMDTPGSGAVVFFSGENSWNSGIPKG